MGVRDRVEYALRANEYRQDEDQPFIWYREVDAGGEKPVTVEVDFLAGEYGGRSKKHRTQHVQDLRPRKGRGADLLFDEVEERDVEAMLPSGAIDSVTVKVAGVAPYIVMKSSALDTRIKQKDAYDIWFVLANYPGGVSAVVEKFAPFADHGLVLEAVSILERKFESPNHFGPTSVAEFLEQSGEEAELTRRDAFERVQALLEGLRRARSQHD